MTHILKDRSDDGHSNKVHLTFDIDWAPDVSIDAIRKVINPRDIKATFFITHPSDIVSDLVADGHEIGIHPNFLSGSSQGDQPEKIIEYLLNIVPNARALRTHALVQSSPLFQRIFSSFPQLRYDLSLFMYRFPHIEPFSWAFGGTKFTRVNYNWEDDAAFFDDGFDWSKPFCPGPVSVYDFHPIHIHLNSSGSEHYDALKQAIQVPLTQVSEAEIRQYQNNGQGARSFLEAMVASSNQHIDFEGLLCA